MTWTPNQPSSGNGTRAKQALRLLKQTESIPRTGVILGVPAAELMDTFSVALAAGCGVLISSTTDGGAVSVTLYAQGERHRAYAASAEDFHLILEAVRDVCEAQMVGRPAGAVNGPLQAR